MKQEDRMKVLQEKMETLELSRFYKTPGEREKDKQDKLKHDAEMHERGFKKDLSKAYKQEQERTYNRGIATATQDYDSVKKFASNVHKLNQEIPNIKNINKPENLKKIQEALTLLEIWKGNTNIRKFGKDRISYNQKSLKDEIDELQGHLNKFF